MRMKQLTPDEVLQYIPLQTGDPDFATRAIAFTLTPCKEPGWEGWEEITYYASNSGDQSSLTPLEIMYEEWNDIV